ncbi:hypothetical protein ACVWYG_001936 [Pedobacter sp. UYEF25]
MIHTFHIPVLGLGYSIDTPLKIARYGISSVVSIVDDIAIERMREYHCKKNGIPFSQIEENENDSRAKRITAYLNLMCKLVDRQFDDLRTQTFTPNSDICRYFELLPKSSIQRKTYGQMLATEHLCEKLKLQHQLRSQMHKGAIDVNIMSKVDKMNFNGNAEALPEIFNDALAALRGFANSDLNSSIILSAGMNPRLYSYLEEFADFFPDQYGSLNKKVVLKVSDFRSAFIQAKFLAKKGIWVSEFRVESGLNCGGHAFATEGFLLGPILEEFRVKRTAMKTEIFGLYQQALSHKDINLTHIPPLKVTVQGGIGTAEEHAFFLTHYNLDAAGWGSPFLLVPETTNVDETTLRELVSAKATDFFISGSSPLGIPFNNFGKSSGEKQRLERIARDRPGSPCTKKFLVSNTEFTAEPICTASRKYQFLKIKALKTENLSQEIFRQKFDAITEKTCLCQGLVTSAYLKNGMLKPKENQAVTICPGPNLAYFKGIFSLEEMIKHIYGYKNLLKGVNRPHIFINELVLYIDYLKKDLELNMETMDTKKQRYLVGFSAQLQVGIDYYKSLFKNLKIQKKNFSNNFLIEVDELEARLNALKVIKMA